MSQVIKKDSNYKELSELLGVTDLSDRIIDKMTEAELLYDDPDGEYGKTIQEIIDKAYAGIIETTIFCLDKSTKKIQKMFSKLIVFGTGECDECGGDIEADYDSSRAIHSGDYLVPDDDEMEFRCTNCGHSIIK